MKITYKIIIVLCTLFFIACEDVVNIELDTAPAKLVIDASLKWEKGTTGNEQTIKLTTTTDFYATTIPVASGAVVFVRDENANQFDFVNSTQKWNNFSNVGVGLNVPIFSSGGRNSRVQQAKIDLEKSRTQLTETEQKLKLQYQKAKSDYEYSINQYNNAQANLKLAERIEAKQQVKFKEGLSSSFDFAEAQKQLYAAQQETLQAMLEIINKKATLEKLVN